jgi:hypothetical protein
VELACSKLRNPFPNDWVGPLKLRPHGEERWSKDTVFLSDPPFSQLSTVHPAVQAESADCVQLSMEHSSKVKKGMYSYLIFVTVLELEK